MILAFLKTTRSKLTNFEKRKEAANFISIIKNHFGSSGQCKRRKNTGMNTGKKKQAYNFYMIFYIFIYTCMENQAY